MSDRERYNKLRKTVVATVDIADAVGVGISAVSNWTTRWADFPMPMARFGQIDLYPRDEIEACLDRHGRTYTWKDES